MSGDTLRKLAAMGLTIEQIGGVMDLIDDIENRQKEADEARKKVVRDRVQRWRDKRNVTVTLPNVTERYVTAHASVTRVEDNLLPKKITGQEENKDLVRQTEDQFAQIWSAYPRKTGKGEARAKFDKAIKAAGFPALLAGVQRYAADRQGEDPQFTMQMSRWLHGQHWTDEPAQRPRSRAGPPKPMSLGEMFREDARQNGILNDQPPANPPGRMETRNGDGEVAGAGDPRVIALTRNVLGGFR